MKSKRKTLLSRAPSVLIASVIGTGGIMKLVGPPQLVEIYTRIGLLQYLAVLGITEIVLVVLFLWDRTMKIGFLLLTGYFGGAMAVELSRGTIFIFPGVILAIVWIAAYLRNASIFQSEKQVRQLSNASAI